MFESFVEEISDEQKQALVQRAVTNLAGLSHQEVRHVESLRPKVVAAVNQAVNQLGLTIPPDVQHAAVGQVIVQVNGLGFMYELLYERGDINEIMLNPDGTLWLFQKGVSHPFKYMENLDLDEVWRIVDALLAPSGRAINDATPSVNAKLNRDDERGFGGARLKILHPAIVPGTGKNYPSMNIRLFEPKPVPPEKLIEWNVAPEDVIWGLVDLVRRRTRVMVIGGTATGKTTLLSGLCSGIPKEMRVVKLEDPEEIWVDHPHVVTVEARPVSPGAAVASYNLVDAVNDAMRMSPTYLIVGEVRKGDQALALFSAMMSDHPGLTTFHAEGPEQALNRVAILMYADAGVRMEAAKAYFAQAVDLIVQIGWPRDVDGNPLYDADGAHRRKIIGVWEVVKELQGGNVKFSRIYQHSDETLQALQHARQEGGH